MNPQNNIISQGRTQNTRLRVGGGGGGIEYRRHDAAMGESMRGDFPSHLGVWGVPGKIREIVVPEKRFTACFRSKCQVS